MTKKNYKGEIVNIEPIAKDVVRIDIASELKNIKSGQFISVLCPNKTLRRPFSASGFKDNILTILVKMVGEGTKYLQTLKKGDKIDFLAPLGNGFTVDNNKKALLVGAGIGIAPMLFLKEELNALKVENYLIAGFKAQDEVVLGADETVIGGSVLDNIEKIIKEKNIEMIYSCGPKIVLQKLSEIAIANNIDSQLALERVMACSIGVCRGCVIKIKEGEEIINKAVCKDGPVFLGSEIVWE